MLYRTKIVWLIALFFFNFNCMLGDDSHIGVPHCIPPLKVFLCKLGCSCSLLVQESYICATNWSQADSLMLSKYPNAAMVSCAEPPAVSESETLPDELIPTYPEPEHPTSIDE